MRILENLSQLSKRGLLYIPNPPESKYQIIQFPDGFVRVEDTERVFGINEKLNEQNVSNKLRKLFNDDIYIYIYTSEISKIQHYSHDNFLY